MDVLRGRVKVNTHCYETVDLDDLVRVCLTMPANGSILIGRLQISNEFKFPIAAFHHAHETYLVPDTLKAAHGKHYKRIIHHRHRSVDPGRPPAIALFATQARYKREAYRGSEFAPRILADHGLQVVMKVLVIYAL